MILRRLRGAIFAATALALFSSAGADVSGPMTCPLTQGFAPPNNISLSGVTATLTATGGNGCGISNTGGQLITTDSGNLITTDSGNLLTTG